MPTDRATPRAVPDIGTNALQAPLPKSQKLNLEMPNEPVRAGPETSNLLIRMPGWLKPLVKEKAENEGISMNIWVCRMLAEAVKTGIVSQPYALPPRNILVDLVPPYTEAEVDELVIDTAVAAAELPESYTSPVATRVLADPGGAQPSGRDWYGRRRPPHEAVAGDWQTPEGDIPDLS